MTEYVKQSGVWRIRVGGAGGIIDEHTFVKLGGSWQAARGRVLYVKLAGIWRGQRTSARLARQYQLAFPGILAAQASTVESVQARLPAAELEVFSYSLPGDGTLIVNLYGDYTTASAMTTAVKAALEPWAQVTSLGSLDPPP